MSTDRWDRVAEIFQEALGREPEDRERYLDEACGEDEEIRREVRSLLAAGEGADSFLDRPAMLDRAVAGADAPTRDTRESQGAGGDGPSGDWPGPDWWIDRVLGGKYLIEARVGEGGMGVVYRARRVGDFQHVVAVKLVEAGSLRSALVRRFQTERRILARLNHPNIARLLDGGVTDGGMPYVVMEYVEGEPLTRYCDARSLGIDARLDLFRKLCSAVEYAHRNLVIHRDLKPSNVLVTKEGTVKLLDFGIAKLLQSDFDEETLTATRAGERLLTPGYASPEQLRGAPVSTATDVYSLGVILYELLAGRRPFDTRERSLEELARSIETDEPDRPSTAVGMSPETKPGRAGASAATVAEVSRRRATTPRGLQRTLMGDLDQIVLKALKHDPDRRYGSVELFAEDVRLYLLGLPVTARPDAFRYRAGKFVRRHRGPVVAAALAVVALVAGAGLFAWQARAARAAERHTARLLYASRMKQAYDFWAKANTKGAIELLEATRPAPGGEDYRHFEWYYLWQQTHLERRVMPYPTGLVNATALSLSPDGRVLAASFGTGQIALWDAETGRELASVQAHSGFIRLIVFSPTAPRLATVSVDGTVKVWDLDPLRESASLEGFKAENFALAFSADGRRLGAASAGDVAARVWNMDDGSELLDVALDVKSRPGPAYGGESRAAVIAFSPDLDRLAVGVEAPEGAAQHRIWIFELKSGRRVAELASTRRPVVSLAFSPDGTTLASSTKEDVGLWDLRTGSELGTLGDRSGLVWGLVFSADGSVLASSSWDRIWRFWDVRERKLLKILYDVGATMAATPDLKTIASGRVKNLAIWGGETEVGPSQFDAWLVALSPDGARLLACEPREPTELFWWDTARARRLSDGAISLKEHGSQQVQCGHNMRVPPTGLFHTFGASGPTVHLWDAATGTELGSLAITQPHRTPYVVHGASHTLVPTRDGVLVWDVATGQSSSGSFVHAMLTGAGLSRDGRFFATGNSHGEVKIWDVDSRSELVTFDAHGPEPVWAMAFSPDNTLIATGSEDSNIRLWSVPDGRPVATLTGHRYWIFSLSFSPDGKRLVSNGSDGTFGIWDVETGQQVAALTIPDFDVAMYPPFPVFASNDVVVARYAEGRTFVWSAAPSTAVAQP